MTKQRKKKFRDENVLQGFMSFLFKMFSIKFSGGILVHDPYNILRGRVNFLNKFLRVDRSGRGLCHNEMIKVTGENYLLMGDQGSP